MSHYRYCASGSGRLKLSIPRKKPKGRNLQEWRKMQKEAKQAISNAPSEPIVPKVEPSTSEFQSNCDPQPSESKFRISNEFCVEGRRIININFFLIELQKLNKHSQSGCSLNDIIILSEDKTGLLSCFHCKCKACEFEKVFWTEDPEKEGTNINSDAVAGLVSIGCWFRNMRKVFTKMDIPTLTETQFSKEYDKLLQQMKTAIDEDEIGTTEDEARMIVEYDDAGLGTSDRMKTPEEEIINGEQKHESVVLHRSRPGGMVSDAIIAIVEELETHVDEEMNDEQEAESVVASEEIVSITDRINTAGEMEESSHEITNDEQETKKPKDGSIQIVAKRKTVVDKETVAHDDDSEIIRGEEIDQEIKRSVDEAIVVENATIMEDAKSLNTAKDGNSMNTPFETNNSLPGQIYQDSGNSDTSAPLMTPPKDSGMQPYFRCEDCSADFRKNESLRAHRMYYCNSIRIPSSSTVKSHTLADASDSPELMDFSQPWASSRLSVLKLAMAELKAALGEAMKVVKELQNLINFQKSAKKHKERGLETPEEAMVIDKAIISSNRSNERLFVSDMKTRTVSEVESALAFEKYVGDTLEPTVRKQTDVLEAAVEAISQEQSILAEFAKVIADGKESTILTLEKHRIDKTLILEKSTGIKYKRKLDAVSEPASNTIADVSDSPVQFMDLSQSWASFRLSVLILAMAELKAALGGAMKVVKELQNLINFKKSAKKHKVRGLETMEEAIARERTITSSNRSNELLFVSDMNTRAVSEVESALALEKYVVDTLEPTVRKQTNVLEAAVEAISREQSILAEFAKVIEDGKESAILTFDKHQKDKTLISEKSTGITYKRKLDAVSEPASNEQREIDQVGYQLVEHSSAPTSGNDNSELSSTLGASDTAP